MSTGPHVIAITLLIAWLLALVAAIALTVQEARVGGRWLPGMVALAVLWVSVLVQILYWLGVGD